MIRKTGPFTGIAFCLILLLLSFKSLTQEIHINRIEATQFTILENTQHSLKICNTVREINSFTVKTPEGNYSELLVEGYTPTRETGSPKLPVMRKLIELPHDAEVDVIIESYDVDEFKLSDYGIVYPLMPAQPPVPKIKDKDIPFVINRQEYRKNQYLEHNLVNVEEIGISRGIRLARLDILPVKYNPRLNSILVYNNIRFEVRFRHANFIKTRSEKQRLYSPYFDFIRSQVISFDQSKDFITQAPVKFVIVSDPLFQSALQPFVQWKRKKGFIVIEAYTNTPQVGNTTSSIRNYLQSLYNAATTGDPAPSFVLFVGDVAQVPSFSGVTGGHATDLHYCEYTNDFLPEVYYGRFSATNVNELLPQINKTLEYEQYLMTDPSFLGKAVLIAGMDATYGPDHGNAQINYGTSTYFNTAHGINCTAYLYPASGSSASQIIQGVSSGAGFVNYTAHGAINGWSDPAFTTSNIPSLQNQGKYPLMIGNACITNSFNYPECFGEALLRAANKGAIGYIGGSGDTYWDEDFYWAVGLGSPYSTPTYANTSLGMFDRVFHDHGEPFTEWFMTQGQMVYAGNLAVTQSGSSDFDYYWEIYHLMGDPSLMIYLKVPPTITANYMSLIPLGINTFSVTTVPYAYIALSDNGILHGAGFADSTGNAIFPIIPFTIPGMADIVITAQNRQPFIDSVTVASPQGPYVLNKNVYLKDPTGNNDSKADYGETINLDVTLINYGNSPGSGVNAILSSADTCIIITDSTATWGYIGPGDTSLLANAFTLVVKNYIPDQHKVIFNLSVHDSSTNVWNSPFIINLNAPAFEVTNITINDNSTGNGNGWLDPGETAEFRFTTRNSGHSDAFNTIGYLSSSSLQFTVNNNNHFFNTLGSGAASDALFSVTLDASANAGSYINFDYMVSSGMYNRTENYQIMIGPAQEDWETGTFTKFHWENDASHPWILTTTDPYEGLFAARSGNIGDYQSSQLSISMNIISGGNISFYRKVSSEEDYDFLEFYIDGVIKGQWSGEEAWDLETYAVSTGVHTFKWIYKKDIYVNSGSDCGWIDYINFPPFANILTFVEEKITHDTEFKCYPNPASDMTYISLNNPASEMTDIGLYNILGEKVRGIFHGKLSEGLHTFTVPVNQLEHGLYFIVLHTERSTNTFKLIVTH